MNLEKRPDRWEHAIQQFKRHRILAERFNAFDGNLIFNNQKPLLPGEFGCLFTHFSIIMDAKSNNYEKILIFEDDIELHPQFNEIASEFLSQVPDNWDMLYLGANQARSTVLDVTKRVRAANQLLGGHAYAVKNTAYDRLLFQIKNSPFQIDEIYAREQIFLNTYLCNPVIAWQTPGWSDINNQVVNYEFLKENK